MLGAAMRMATAGVQQVRASIVVPTPICACAPWLLLADMLWPYFILWICVGVLSCDWCVRESICLGKGLCWMQAGRLGLNGRICVNAARIILGPWNHPVLSNTAAENPIFSIGDAKYIAPSPPPDSCRLYRHQG